MVRTERISLVLSTLALLCAIAALALPVVVLKASPSARLMRLASPLERFNDKQFDAIVSILDRAAKVGSKALTDEALAQIDEGLKEMEAEADGSGGGLFNPTMQLSDARNAQRRSDVNTILNAVYQYAIDNNGNIPKGITDESMEICATAATDCTGKVDLDVLTGAYLVAIPRDAQADPSGNGTRYFIWRTDNRITVSAPDAENEMSISVTR